MSAVGEEVGVGAEEGRRAEGGGVGVGLGGGVSLLLLGGGVFFFRERECVCVWDGRRGESACGWVSN